jgi:hypothetical protein
MVLSIASIGAENVFQIRRNIMKNAWAFAKFAFLALLFIAILKAVFPVLFSLAGFIVTWLTQLSHALP